MNWASHAISALQQGQSCQIRPRGHSMTGKVNDGALVTLVPAQEAALVPGAIVLVKVRGTVYLHLIHAVQGPRYLIGNNRGGLNGWVTRNSIYGLAVRVE